MDHTNARGPRRVRGQLQHRFRAARILRSGPAVSFFQESVAAHILAHYKEISLMLFERKNSGNGGMREGGRNSCLTLQPFAVPASLECFRGKEL